MQWEKYPDLYNDLKETEKQLRKSLVSRNKLISCIVGELLEAGGKRIRPALLIISSKYGSPEKEKVISMAGALEILHTATLVHDDVIDRSKLRRGKVTVSEKYGVEMAIYTGDFLFTKAVLMLSTDLPTNHMELVAKSIKSICEGEVDQYEEKYNIEGSIINYLKRVKRKTAVLFAAAAASGAKMSGCTDDVTRNLTKFGLCYGVAFQIKDDLNDYLSSSQITGKPVGKDLLEGVVTLPAMYAMRNSPAVKDAFSLLRDKKNTISQKEVVLLVEMVKDFHGIEDSKVMLEKYINRAIKCVDNLPENEYNQILRELINELKV